APVNEWHWRHADSDQEQAVGNEPRLAAAFHHFADCAALDNRANNSTKREKKPNNLRVLRVVDVEMKILCDQQAKSDLEAGEAKCRQKENHHQQADLGMVKRMQPLGKARASSHML